MPYIFVRGTMQSNGRFQNVTWIDFQFVGHRSNEPLGKILSRHFGGACQVTEVNNPLSDMQFLGEVSFDCEPGQSQTLEVFRPPHEVLNALELHAGCKVVAANYQRAQGCFGNDPSYTLWTLHF